jgi:hypothetical protein
LGDGFGVARGAEEGADAEFLAGAFVDDQSGEDIDAEALNGIGVLGCGEQSEGGVGGDGGDGGEIEEFVLKLVAVGHIGADDEEDGGGTGLAGRAEGVGRGDPIWGRARAERGGEAGEQSACVKEGAEMRRMRAT